MALYHRFGNPVFPLLLERLASAPVTTIPLARTDVQAADLEAAVLGTPAWSIYAGKLAAVDRALVAAGSLHLLHDVQDLARIPLRKKAAALPPRISDALVVQFVDRLLKVARR